MQDEKPDYLDQDDEYSEDLGENLDAESEAAELDDEEDEEGEASEAPAPVAAAPAARVVADEAPAANPRVLNRLLAMADRYRSEGITMQAMEMYWKIYEDHPGTEQAERATDALLEIADGFEAEGARRLARSIYERLL